MDTTLSADQERILRARSWLGRAKNDYRGYLRIVGRQYIISKRALPDDPALAIYLLQQTLEKTVKAVAVASGEFEYKEFRREYSHNSLRLFADIISKLIEVPVVQSALTTMKDSLGEMGDKYLDINVMRRRIADIKQNTDVNRPPDLPDWIKEFGLLPEHEIRPVVTMLIGLRSTLQSGLYKVLKPNISFDVTKVGLYLANPTDSNLESILAPSFRNRQVPLDALALASKVFPVLAGHDFHTLLDRAIRQEPVLGSAKTKRIGKRQTFEKSVSASWALGTLMFLAAFSFPHESWARYPDRYKSKSDLDCESYKNDLGIVSCLREIGYLTRDTLSDVDRLLEMIAGFFTIYKRSVGQN